MAELTKANGGRLFDLRTGRPTFTEKQVVEVLDFYKKLNDTVLPPGWLGHGYLDTFTNLATGKAPWSTRATVGAPATSRSTPRKGRARPSTSG